MDSIHCKRVEGAKIGATREQMKTKGRVVCDFGFRVNISFIMVYGNMDLRLGVYEL